MTAAEAASGFYTKYTEEECRDNPGANSSTVYAIRLEERFKQFAEQEVKAALEAAIKKLPFDDRMNQDILLTNEIRNAYPSENIK
jgi:hypothetical protein